MSAAAGSPVARIASANVLSQAIGLVLTLLAAAIIGVSEFGAFTAMTIWLGVICPIASWGIPDAQVTNSRSGADVLRVYRSGFALSILVGALAGFATCAVFVLMLDRPVTDGATGAAYAMVTLLSGWVSSLEQRHENFGLYNRLLVWGNGLGLLLVLLVLVSADLRTASFVLLARTIGLSLPLVIRLAARREYLASPSIGTMIMLLRSGTRFHSTAILSIASNRLDQVLSSRFLGGSELGSLGLILPFGNGARSLGKAVSTVHLVRSSELGSKLDVYRQIQRMSKVAFASGAGVGVFATGALSLLLYVGERVGADMPVLNPATIIACAIYMASAACIATADVSIRLHRVVDTVLPGIIARVVAVCLVLPSGLILIPKFGLVGSSIAALIGATTTLTCLTVHNMRKIEGLDDGR